MLAGRRTIVPVIHRAKKSAFNDGYLPHPGIANSGHDVMVDAPEWLVDVLLQVS
jgi:hypothetical protein